VAKKASVKKTLAAKGNDGPPRVLLQLFGSARLGMGEILGPHNGRENDSLWPRSISQVNFGAWPFARHRRSSPVRGPSGEHQARTFAPAQRINQFFPIRQQRFVRQVEYWSLFSIGRGEGSSRAQTAQRLDPFIFIRRSDRIAPTATRYPAPSQLPHKERSGEGKLSHFFVADPNQFFSIPRKVFEPSVHSYERLQKSCG